MNMTYKSSFRAIKNSNKTEKIIQKDIACEELSQATSVSKELINSGSKKYN